MRDVQAGHPFLEVVHTRIPFGIDAAEVVPAEPLVFQPLDQSPLQKIGAL